MMPAQSAKHALFQHLKLSGYLQLVVSVGTSSPSLVSGSLVSSPPTGALHTPLPCNSQSGSTGWDKPQQNGSRCDGGLSEGSFCCPDQGASANEVSDKQSLVGKEANGSNMDPQQSGSFQSDIFEQLEGDTQTICSRCPDFIRYSSLSSDGFTQEGTSDSYQPHDKPSKIIPCLDSHGLMALENAEMLIGAECWLTREGGSVELHTDRGFVLRSIASQSCQDTRENIMQVRFRADTLDLTFADSLQGFFGTVSSSMSMEFGEPCGASVYDDEVCGNEHLKASPCAGRSDVGENCSRNQLEINVRVESTPAAECPQGSDYMNFLYQNKKGTVGKKRKPAGRANGTSDILHQIQLLCVRNFVRVQGHVVRVSRKAADVRAVVLLDLYLPSSLWAGRNYWKPGPAVAAVLNHISCDWEDRRRTLGGVCNCQKLENVECEGMWTLGACQVLGCKMHFEASEATKRTRFDLHALFKALPSISRDQKGYSTAISPQHGQKAWQSGIWDIPDEILTSAFSRLLPRDLQSVAATCRHTRELAVSIMPCMNLKLFPHQQAAVSWMLHRELNPQTLVHPLFRDLQTEDGFHFYLNCVSGDLSPEVPPSVMDFRGGLFCDEPGLGKTVTALSLILKTQGTLSEPPSGAEVQWCEHRSGDRYGYYEISLQQSTSVLKRCMDLKAMRNRADVSSPLSRSLSHGTPKTCGSLPMSTGGRKKSRSSETASSNRTTRRRLLESGQAARTPNSVKRKLLEAYEGLLADGSTVEQMESFSDGRHKKSAVMINSSSVDAPHTKFINSNSSKVDMPDYYEDADVWVECDSCSKWRKLPDGSKPPEEGLAWFCNMNKDPLHQSCSDPEENWDDRASIKYLPGFYKVGSSSGQEQNITHFANVLKENGPRRDLETTAALTWLANLTPEKLTKLASIGLAVPPGLRLMPFFGDDQHAYDKIFQRFGLVQRREGRGVTKWCYPRGLDTGLVFDLPALREALTRPLDVVRLYLSRATLIVVPPNLVEHWKNQILRHTKPGQLRVYVWNEQKRPPQAQDLAWNFDVVITTFPRLSSEWSSRESSVLMSVHWLRIMLDEGHTLGSSLSLTNKLQMAVSMHASRRWLLTGTPTPNTPNSQVAHLQPMLRFLHEEVYGEHQKSWEGGILKPFEAGLEEGRANLLQVLRRCMISARKSDLCTIPPCVRKVQLLDFTQKHAESYNELVVTVRRNILMADWNDPSHVESLLNPKQWKFRSNTIRNVRLSCCVAGHIKVRNAGEDIQETMEILAQQGMDSMSIEFAIIRTALLYGGNCNRCQEWCRLPIVTPCRHLLCLDCVALDRERCTLPDCGNPYKMQSPEDLTRPENPNPKWPVPQDLIELQPSYVQDNWDPDWQGTSSSKVAYLVERLKTLQGANGDQNLCLEKEDDGEKSPERCFSNPSCGGIDQHEKSQNQQKGSPEKAIVFSQFLEHIHVIERQLTEAGIKVAGMYSPMHSSNKMKSLLSFQNDSDCTVLLMDGSAALGLDLSFVTHVFLMEPIWDRSMEEQVVSRAHRMGATRPVLVETLAMRGTIEEQMLEFLQDPVEHSRALKQEALNIPEYGRSSQRTVHDFAESSYLARLSFVRTSGG